MIRGESKGATVDFVMSNVWGWLIVFPLLFTLLWATGQFETESKEEAPHAQH